MELTKEQYLKRKNCLGKFYIWFGSKEIKKFLKNNYDYFIDDTTYFYVFKKLTEQKI
jgi:hypothetical protein